MAASTAFNASARVQAIAAPHADTRQIATGKVIRTEKIASSWIISVFGLLICTFLVYFHTVLIENQANKKQQQIMQIQEQNDMLQAQLAELKTLPAVESRAQAMGMQPVEQYHYISIESELYRQATHPPALDVSPVRYPVQPPIGF
ncbi:MAG: hypothetical protein IGS03_06930 [Candidatus Sericytochromatia bacterium]|nr:hypothetical protein [Candidatus Sericytochromatia bacterium]